MVVLIFNGIDVGMEKDMLTISIFIFGSKWIEVEI